MTNPTGATVEPRPYDLVVRELKLTLKPELAVAPTANGAMPKVWVDSAEVHQTARGLGIPGVG